MKEEIMMIMNQILQMPVVQRNLLGQQDLIKTFLDVWKYKGDKDAVSMTPEELMDKLIQRMKEQEEQMKQEQMDEAGEKISNQADKMNPLEVEEVLNERTGS